MVDQNQLQEKIRCNFFELISDSVNHSYDDHLSILTRRLKELLHTKHAAVYIYDNWKRTYDITPNYTRDVSLEEFIPQFIDQNLPAIEENQIIHGTANDIEAFAIPIRSPIEPVGLLFFSADNNNNFITNELAALLKREIEQFLNIINNYQTSKENERKNTFLYNLTSRFYSSINKNDILTETTNALRTLYPTFTFYILLSQDFKADSTLPVKEIEYSDDATKRVSTQAFITGEVQLEDRVKEKSSCLYAPLKGNQGVYGVIQIITPQTVEFLQKEIEFITEIANVVGKAIENATLYQHSRRLVSDLKRINEATHQLNSNLKIAEITEIVRRQIVDTCSANQVGFIYSNEKSEQSFDVLSGSTDYFYSDQGHAFAEYLLNQMNTDKEAIFSGDLSDFQGLPYRSVMAIPMLQSGVIHGVITIMHEQAYFFSFENFKLMQSLIQHSTLALTNSILKDKLEVAVIKDYLTKLYSRKYLDEKIQMHMETDEKGTLILFDIDDFKTVNDTYGHHVGDEVIIQVANIITVHLGKDDIPARWGGEELAVYLPDTTMDEGVYLAGQIRKQVENFTDPMITLSCGVSTWFDKSKDSVRDVFLRADKALYEAKKIGKNCVVKGNFHPTLSFSDNSIPNKS